MLCFLFTLQKGADLHAVDKNDYTALHLAAREGNADGCELLIEVYDVII